MNNQIEFNIDENNNKIYLITTSVGEDALSMIGISWHCVEKGSYLLIKKDGEGYIKVLPIEDYWSVEESYVDSSYQNKRYVCRVNLSNLYPNCIYKYKIMCGNYCSKEYSFKTGSLLELKFMAFADFQYSENDTTINLVNLFANANPDINLIMCSGDIADEGYKEEAHRFIFDKDLFKDKVLAFGCGDHEYWGSIKSPIKMLSRPFAYNKLFNNPKNGCESCLNSSFYFKYNKILFVFLDCGDSNIGGNNKIFNDQALWIDNVLSNESGYEFIIVSMHKSLYGDIKQDSNVRKFAPTFIEVFDKYKVDLVISGHDHEYSRTKPLINSIVNEYGTVYLDLGSSGDKRRSTGDSIKNSLLYDKYLDIFMNNYSLGVIGMINSNKMSLTIRNQYYDIVDYVEIKRKQRN